MKANAWDLLRLAFRLVPGLHTRWSGSPGGGGARGRKRTVERGSIVGAACWAIAGGA